MPLPKETNPVSVTIGNRMRIMMAIRGITSADLMRKTTMGSGQISNYLNAHFMMKADRLVTICNALDCSADYLLGLSNNPKRNK